MNETITDIFIPVQPYMLWIASGVVIILSIIMSFVFKYHWNYYGISVQNKVFVTGIYTLGSVLVVIVLLILSFSY